MLSLLLLAATPPLQAAPAPSPANPIEADWRAIPDDELMIVTAIPDQAARHDSYTRLAQAWGLGAVSEAA